MKPSSRRLSSSSSSPSSSFVRTALGLVLKSTFLTFLIVVAASSVLREEIVSSSRTSWSSNFTAPASIFTSIKRASSSACDCFRSDIALDSTSNCFELTVCRPDIVDCPSTSSASRSSMRCATAARICAFSLVSACTLRNGGDNSRRVSLKRVPTLETSRAVRLDTSTTLSFACSSMAMRAATELGTPRNAPTLAASLLFPILLSNVPATTAT
mmetsp:Transcript_5720/g.19277  ORF Transcript_5720/g.19277 Transcript_5720/m.19277 type:complete len:213 (-) Transcript_5720:643-1281(-)